MSVSLFVTLAVILCAVSGLLTEAIKQWFKNQNDKNYSANLIAIIDAVVVGCGGTSIAYILLGVPFTLANIACMICMFAVVGIGSMIGYDKVIQLIKQIAATRISSDTDAD